MTPSSSAAALSPRSATSTASRPPLTQAAILQIGYLAHSADVRASRIKSIVPGMIESALTTVVTPLRESIAALMTRIEVSEGGKGATHALTALKAQLLS